MPYPLLVASRIRLAVLADIHANLPALEAVLADAAPYHVDGFIVAGDHVTTGPHPASRQHRPALARRFTCASVQRGV